MEKSKKKKIRTVAGRKQGVWMVICLDKPELKGSGKSEAEARGDFIYKNQEALGLEIQENRG